jgi:hypothetical protein
MNTENVEYEEYVKQFDPKLQGLMLEFHPGVVFVGPNYPDDPRKFHVIGIQEDTSGSERHGILVSTIDPTVDYEAAVESSRAVPVDLIREMRVTSQ